MPAGPAAAVPLPAGATKWRAAYAGDTAHAAAVSPEVTATGLRHANADSQHLDGRQTPPAGSFIG